MFSQSMLWEFFSPQTIHFYVITFFCFMYMYLSFSVTMQLMLSYQMPRKMLLQMYNLLHAMSRNDRDFDYYHR